MTTNVVSFAEARKRHSLRSWFDVATNRPQGTRRLFTDRERVNRDQAADTRFK